MPNNQTEEYNSQLEILKEEVFYNFFPGIKGEKIYQLFPGKEGIAINVSKLGNLYGVAIGERVGDSFVIIGEASLKPLPENSDLVVIANNELSPFGDKAKEFDIFVEGKLIRGAQK